MRISDWSSDVCSSDLFGDRFGVAWICRHHISNSTDPVDALAAIGLLRGDGESEFFLERPGKGAAHRVCLPAGSRADLSDGGSLRALQNLDQGRLLSVLAGAGLARGAALEQAIGRHLYFF